MPHLLYIESSPRKERSASIKIAKAFLDEYKKTHPDDTIETLDLWNTELPSFDGDTINAKYSLLHARPESDAERKAWEPVAKTIDNFMRADKIVISIPMWNFGIPYKLKHFIDIIIQPSYTFSYSPEAGYKGLVKNKSALLVFASGGAYSSDMETEGLDHQRSYMNLIMGFMGFTDIKSIIAEPMLMSTPEEKLEIIEGAKAEARNLAATF